MSLSYLSTMLWAAEAGRPVRINTDGETESILLQNDFEEVSRLTDEGSFSLPGHRAERLTGGQGRG